MIKKSYVVAAVAALFLSASVSFAQNARETTAKFKDNLQPAITASYVADPDFVESSLKEKLAKDGFGKRSSESGYDAYKATFWGRVSSDKLDIYMKVNGKRGNATVTMLLAKGYDNFVSGNKDAALVSKVQDFLNSFADYLKTKQAIMQQEDVVKKMDAEQKKLNDESADLVKQREALEKKMAENKASSTQKQAMLDAEKAKLEDIKKQQVN